MRCVMISDLEPVKNEAQTTFQISEECWKNEKLIILFCRTKKGKYSGEVFNSTCPPSGNLVDGSPLDLLIRMQEDMTGIGPAL